MVLTWDAVVPVVWDSRVAVLTCERSGRVLAVIQCPGVAELSLVTWRSAVVALGNMLLGVPWPPVPQWLAGEHVWVILVPLRHSLGKGAGGLHT